MSYKRTQTTTQNQKNRTWTNWEVQHTSHTKEPNRNSKAEKYNAELKNSLEGSESDLIKQNKESMNLKKSHLKLSS